MPAWEIQRLSRSHDRSQLDCGVGFVPLVDDKHHLFLPMQVIRKLKLPRL